MSPFGKSQSLFFSIFLLFQNPAASDTTARLIELLIGVTQYFLDQFLRQGGLTVDFHT